MKTINLNYVPINFTLGGKKYVYTPNIEDRNKLIETMKNMDIGKKEEILKALFEEFLSKENGKVDLKNEDIIGLSYMFVGWLL